MQRLLSLLQARTRTFEGEAGGAISVEIDLPAALPMS